MDNDYEGAEMAVQEKTYETMVCDCKRVREDGPVMHPRYCGKGRVVHLPVPELRFGVRAAKEKAVEDHPVPPPGDREVVPLDHEKVTNPARAFAKKALGAGWGVKATYVHGPQIGARRNQWKMVDSVMIQCQRDGYHIRACWVDGTADTCGYTNPRTGRAKIVSVTEAKLLLTSGDATE